MSSSGFGSLAEEEEAVRRELEEDRRKKKSLKEEVSLLMSDGDVYSVLYTSAYIITVSPHYCIQISRPKTC